jgi:hypothetical protein
MQTSIQYYNNDCSGDCNACFRTKGFCPIEQDEEALLEAA